MKNGKNPMWEAYQKEIASDHKLGIEYNPNEKYKGLNGLDLGKPELPNTLKCC